MTIVHLESDKTSQARPSKCRNLSPVCSLGPRAYCARDVGHDGWHKAATLFHHKYGLIDGLRWSDPTTAID